MEENENLKLEVQGLRSLMQGINAAANAAASQPPGTSQAPAQVQVSTLHLTCARHQRPGYFTLPATTILCQIPWQCLKMHMTNSCKRRLALSGV